MNKTQREQTIEQRRGAYTGYVLSQMSYYA